VVPVYPVRTSFLAIPEMPHAGSGTIKGHSDPNLANCSAASLPSTHLWPGTHISWALLHAPSFTRDWWQSQTSFELIRQLSGALTTTQLSKRVYWCVYFYSPYLDSDCACLNGIHFCLEYCGVLFKTEAKLLPCAISIHHHPSALCVLCTRLVHGGGGGDVSYSVGLL
jgi:hypothetical protein